MGLLVKIKIFCTLCFLIIKRNNCLNFIDIPSQKSQYSFMSNAFGEDSERRNYPPIRTSTAVNSIRRYLIKEQNSNKRASSYEDEKDANLKFKISTLVQQTVHDTENKIKSINHIKEKYREDAPYKTGFILSMIKKSRDVLNELFNVAVKHKDEWKALEQLKIFELVMHTNVDTTNLVRQLVEVHIQYLNSTSTENAAGRKRVVVLK